MKLTVIFLFAACMHVSARTEGQTITLSAKNKSLEKVLAEIKRQSGFSFIYGKKLLSTAEPVSIDVKNEPLTKVLDLVFQNQKLTYKVSDTYIVVSPKTEKFQPPVPSVEKIPTPLPAIIIKGKVVDEKGTALSGASVNLKNSDKGVATDAEGNFLIEIPDAGGTLIISYVGYQTIEMPVSKSSGELRIVLKLAESTGEEIVVVGYGTQKKVNLTGAVGVVDGKRLQDRPVNNVPQALYGTTPGLTIAYGNRGFEPGAGPSIQIRGQGAPLILIDGTVGDINTLDPNTVESISILKDAAASAIYGPRAPFGVLLITTKSGKANQKPQIDFSTNGGPTTISRKPRMPDSYTFARAMNEIHDNQGVARLFAESTIDRIIAYINDPSLPETVPNASNPTKWNVYELSNGNNDWIDVHFGSGFRTQENLSVRGGSNDIRYFLSVGHAYEKGPLKMVSDKYNRYNMSAKLDANVTNWWKISSNTRLTNEVRDRPIYNGEGEYGLMIHQIFRTHPEVFLKSPNGHYSQLSRVPQMRAGYQKFTDNNLVQRLATEIKPAKNWSVNADYSIDYGIGNYEGINLVAYEDQVDGRLVPIALTVPSYITKSKDNTTYKSLNIFSTYKFNLGTKNHFDILAGYQQEANKYDYLEGYKVDIISPTVPSISTATGPMQAFDDLSHSATQGYFARLNYNFDERYLLESNIRYNGSSKFREENRWGLFSSVSAGWILSKEKFWNKLSRHIPYFKLRASWGSLGNINGPNYADLALLGVNTNLNWMINGIRPAYVTAPNITNPNLIWESSKTTDVGIDMGLLKNRLQVEFDYYQRLTFDRLGAGTPLPAVLGTTPPQENNTELRTRGWDFSLTWKSKAGRDFSYSISANVFDYLSTVTKFNNPNGFLNNDYKGFRVGDIWGFETVGLIQDQRRADEINSTGYQSAINAQTWRTGDVEYRDLNGDGKINIGKNTLSDHGDLTIIGNSTRRYQFGLNSTASYKNFDLAVFIQGTAKRDLWLSGNVFWGFNSWNQSSLFANADHLNYYRDKDATKYSGLGINTEAYFPRPYSNATQYRKNQQVQTRYLQNGAYARLKNVQLGYTLPQAALNWLHLKRARFYFSGENIYTLTKLPVGFDPETATLGELGMGKNMFMQAIWSFGLNVSF